MFSDAKFLPGVSSIFQLCPFSHLLDEKFSLKSKIFRIFPMEGASGVECFKIVSLQLFMHEKAIIVHCALKRMRTILENKIFSSFPAFTLSE